MCHRQFYFLGVNEQLEPNLTSPIDILYQDEWFIAINKPSGQLVHRSPLDPHATDFAVQQVRDSVDRYVYPVHRLDRPTSGVLLFTFFPELVTAMQMIWEQGVTKRYCALVRGWVHGNGYIDYPLKYQADKLAEPNKKVDLVQTATSSYQGVEHFEAPFSSKRHNSCRYSLLTLWIHTGRKHQLRRHLAHIRHPIIGDTTHGDSRQNKIARQHLGCKQLLLTCNALCFAHPKTQKSIVINSPPSNNLNSCLTRLRSEDYLSLESV